jgi:hypothetical protein
LLNDCDLNARPINFFGKFQRQARTPTAVIDLHEHVTKGEIFTPRGIARREPNVPLILTKTLVIAGRVFVR